MEHLITGRYCAGWGHAVNKKEQAVMGSLGQSGLTPVSEWCCVRIIYYYFSQINSLDLMTVADLP